MMKKFLQICAFRRHDNCKGEKGMKVKVNIKSIIKKMVPKKIYNKYKFYKYVEIYKRKNKTENIKNIIYDSSKDLTKLAQNVKFNYNNEYFFYSLDYESLLYFKNTVIDNLSLDYERTFQSLDYISKNVSNFYEGKDVIEFINAMIDKIIKTLKDSDFDRAKTLKKYFEDIKSKPVLTFDEALQRILFYNQLLWQTNHHLNGLGRLDKILIKYYQHDIAQKIITKDSARESIKQFILLLHKDYEFKSNSLLGDTGQIILLGGYLNDDNEICNDLTYLFIDAIKELHLPDPKIMLRITKNTPRDLIKLAVECISTGIGCPILANDEVIIKSLISDKYDKCDAFNYGTSACWEPIIIGKSFDQNNLRNIIYLEPLNQLLNSENLKCIKSFDELKEKYIMYLKKYIKGIVEDVNLIKFQKDAFLSVFIDDCIKKNRDIANGGAKYNNFGLLTLALSNLINSLLVIKKYVFDDKKYSLQELNTMRIKDNLPKLPIENSFGNENDYIIKLTNDIVKITSDELNKYNTSLNGKFKFGLSSPSYLSGAVDYPASFDGRKKGDAFATHISSDKALAYTELINFSGKLDYSGNKLNGNVVDFMVSPSFIEKNKDKFIDLIISSIKIGFFEMQMNVVSSETLIEAKAHPEKFPNLIVRVWGFSAYFNDLPEKYKDVLIQRALKSEGKR